MKKALGLLLALALLLFALPAYAAGSYEELAQNAPDGAAIQAISGQDGALIAAIKDADGQYGIMKMDADGNSEIIPLEYDGHADITHVSALPEGGYLVVLSNMPTLGSKGADGEGPQVSEKSEGGMKVEGPGTASGGEPKMVIASMDDMKTEVLWFAPGGTATAATTVDGIFSGVVALEKGNFAVIGMMNGGAIYGQDGKEIAKISAEAAVDAALLNGTLYVSSEGQLSSFDVNTGKKLGSVSSALTYGVKLAADGGALYAVSNAGAFEVNVENGELTEVVGALGTMLGDPSNGVDGAARLSDGTFAVLLSEGSSSGGGGRVTMRIGESNEKALMMYKPLGEDTAGRESFKITALTDSTLLRKAASEFQKLHPELSVELQTMLTGEEEVKDDAIRALNTDLLAGKGGDVLVMDDLPLDKYIDKGVLLDISDFADGLGLLPGVLSGAKRTDGGVYAVPAQIRFDCLWGNAADISGATSLSDMLAMDLGGRALMSPRTGAELIKLLYPSSATSFRDENGNLNFEGDAFVNFLEALYQIYSEQGEMPNDALSTPDGMSVGAITDMQNGATAFYPTRISSLMEINIAYTLSGAKDSGFVAMPTVDGAGHSYGPILNTGVSALSDKQALAKEFIALLMSPEIQEQGQMDGIPATTEALDQLIDEAAERSKDANIKMAFAIMGTNPIEVEQMDEEALYAFREMIFGLDTQFLADDVLIGFIIEETERLFEGRASAEETASAIMQRAWQYMNE